MYLLQRVGIISKTNKKMAIAEWWGNLEVIAEATAEAQKVTMLSVAFLLPKKNHTYIQLRSAYTRPRHRP